MPQEKPSFDCICRKCGGIFVSQNSLDTDGDGLCVACKERAQQIAKVVQQRIEEIRKNRPAPLPKRMPSQMPGTGYINARDLLL